MKIIDFLSVKGIKVDLEATDKEGILKEMVDLMAEVKDVGDKRNILRALIERENLGSTGIGQGIAIPHGKTDKVDGLVAALGVSRKGVNFEALDGEPVYILSSRRTQGHRGATPQGPVQISRLLRDAYFCERIRKCKTPKEIYDLIAKEENLKV